MLLVLHGLAAHEQLGGDLRIGPAHSDQVRHLSLPAGQRQHRLLPGPPGGQITCRQFLSGAGQGQRGSQGQVQIVRPPQALDRDAPLPGPAQQPAMGQQQPGRVHRALRASSLFAALVDLLGLAGVALLLGQPPLQPGHGGQQITDLAS
jgi:hypothetical protein